MCYNCGCGMPNNDMGKPENITDQRLVEAAKAMGQTLEWGLGGGHGTLCVPHPAA